jgi:hypothetical protein
MTSQGTAIDDHPSTRAPEQSARRAMPLAIGLLAMAVAIAGWGGRTAQALTARDLATSAGLGYFGLTQGDFHVFDYDRDGRRDVMLNTHNTGPARLMRNNGNGTFSEVLAGTFRKYDRHGCYGADFGSIVGDKRPDGRPDIYCTVGADQGTSTREYPKELWIQRPDGTFVNVAREWGLGAVRDRGRRATVLDVNKDGLPDLATVLGVLLQPQRALPQPRRPVRGGG